MEKIPLDFHISGTRIYIPFSAVCSVTDKRFSGEIIIEYHPGKHALEYCDAETRITEITKQLLTAEELAYRIFTEVTTSIRPKALKVTVDVKQSDAHRPVQVWIEKEAGT
jgi:NADPH-dependent 7-cyano-7-deazaguanine reductase QueF